MNFWEKNYESDKNNARTQGIQDDLQEKISEYASKSQDELMRELLLTANRMRADGNLSSNDLENFYNRVSAFLNEEQRERMRALIEMLKG